MTKLLADDDESDAPQGPSGLTTGRLIAGAATFWGILGFAVAAGLTSYAGASAGAITAAGWTGLALGICVGCYAGSSTSVLARILVFPAYLIPYLS